MSDPSKLEIDTVFDTVMYKLKNESVENFADTVFIIVKFGKFFDEMQRQKLFLKFYCNINQVLPYLELDPSMQEDEEKSRFIYIYGKISNDLDEHTKKFGDIHGDEKYEVHLDYLQDRLMRMSKLVALDEYIGYPLLPKFSPFFKKIKEAIKSLQGYSFCKKSSQRMRLPILYGI